MNIKSKLIQRHKNPVGLILRVINYSFIVFSIWQHSLILLSILLVLDIMNWFLMPMVKPKNELKIVNSIIQTEIDWIKAPINLTKTISIVTGIGLLTLLVIGLWHHDWVLLIGAAVAVSLLKHLILIITKQISSKQFDQKQNEQISKLENKVK